MVEETYVGSIMEDEKKKGPRKGKHPRTKMDVMVDTMHKRLKQVSVNAKTVAKEETQCHGGTQGVNLYRMFHA